VWVQQGKVVRKTHGASLKSSVWSSSCALTGIKPTPRHVEVIECAFLAMTSGASCVDPEVNYDFVVDVSQNPARTPWSKHLPSVAQNTELYSFRKCRQIAPVEVLRILGFGDIDVQDLSNEELRSLAGECMSLPTISVVLLAIMLKGRLPDLWLPPPISPSL